MQQRRSQHDSRIKAGIAGGMAHYVHRRVTGVACPTNGILLHRAVRRVCIPHSMLSVPTIEMNKGAVSVSESAGGRSTAGPYQKQSGAGKGWATGGHAAQ